MRASPPSVCRPATLCSSSFTSSVCMVLTVMIFSSCLFLSGSRLLSSQSHQGVAVPLAHWHLRCRLASAVVLVDGRRVATQRRNRDVHVGEQRQIADQVLQFCVVCHIKNAYVGVAAGHPPQVAPLALTLQVLGIGLLPCLDFRSEEHTSEL